MLVLCTCFVLEPRTRDPRSRVARYAPSGHTILSVKNRLSLEYRDESCSETTTFTLAYYLIGMPMGALWHQKRSCSASSCCTSKATAVVPWRFLAVSAALYGTCCTMAQYSGVCAIFVVRCQAVRTTAQHLRTSFAVRQHHTRRRPAKIDVLGKHQEYESAQLAMYLYGDFPVIPCAAVLAVSCCVPRNHRTVVCTVRW